MTTRHSKNSINPFAKLVDAIAAHDLQLILAMFQSHANQHGGGINSLVSMTLTQGMTDVYNYLSNEISSESILGNVFDYFNVAPLFLSAPATDPSDPTAMQQVVAVDMEDHCEAEETWDGETAYTFGSIHYGESLDEASGSSAPSVRAPSLFPTVIVTSGVQAQQPIVIDLGIELRAQSPGVYQTTLAQEEVPSHCYHGGYGFHDAEMNQVVAVGVEESGELQAVSEPEISYYLLSVEYAASFF